MDQTATSKTPRQLAVSFCTTCKGRVHHVRATLPRTLANLLPGDEVVLLDYDSPDGLANWVRHALMPEIRNGRLRFLHLDEGAQP